MSESSLTSDSGRIDSVNRRAFVRRRSKAGAIIKLSDSPFAPSIKVGVADVSQGGIQILVATKLEPLQRIIVEFQLSCSNSQVLRRGAEIRWIAADADPKRIRAGCAWIDRLSYAELMQLT
jgi:hypothetical protein